MLLGTVSRTVIRSMHRFGQQSLNTVTTNVPGPQFPLYCLGREMLEYRPFVPITHGIRVSTAILSYHGRLSFGITGDSETTPDVDVLAIAVAQLNSTVGDIAGNAEKVRRARVEAAAQGADALKAILATRKY